MKKLYTTLFFLLGACTIALAQKQTGDFEFGAHVGYSNSYVITNEGFNSSYIGGFNAGVSGEYYFADNWGIKAKLIYDQKGWGGGYLTDASGNETDHVNFQLNYVTVPLMANWHFGRTQNLYLDFGPYIGLLMSAKATGAVDNLDVKQYFNTTDAGLCVGAGVKFPISDRNSLFLEFEGQSGIANISNSGGNGDNIQNVRESINIGFTF